jgi:hypothetical protein
MAIERSAMSPMSLNTFDAQTLRQLAEHQPAVSPGCERAERWFGQVAMVVVGLALVLTLVV